MKICQWLLVIIFTCPLCIGEEEVSKWSAVSRDGRVIRAAIVLGEGEFVLERLMVRCNSWLKAQRQDLFYAELRIAVDERQLVFELQGNDEPFGAWERRRKYLTNVPWRVAQCRSVFGYASLHVRSGDVLENVALSNSSGSDLGKDLFGWSAEVLYVDLSLGRDGGISAVMFVRTEDAVSESDALTAVRRLYQRSGGVFVRLFINNTDLFPDVGGYPLLVPLVKSREISEKAYYDSIVDTVSCKSTQGVFSCDSIRFIQSPK